MARRGRQNAELLFRNREGYAVQEHQRQAMASAIAEVDPETLASSDIDSLANQFADRFSLQVPEIIDGAISIEVDEADIDVTGDFRFGAFGSEPTYVSGIRASYYVPYSGETEMFHYAPSTRSLSLPAIELRRGDLKFTYERPDQDVGATKVDFEKELAQVKLSLGWVESDVRTFNASLPAQARERLLARKARVEQMTKGVQSLGVPIRRSSPAQTRDATIVKRNTAPDQLPEKYDVALSFSGENRSYVEEVAEGLRTAGVSVFYDKFEKARLWGKNLIEHLADIYGKRSRFVVMFISKSYVEKAWTTHERRHAQDRALLAQSEYILPARFDDTEVPGMTTTVGFVDLRETHATELVQLILSKLGRT